MQQIHLKIYARKLSSKISGDHLFVIYHFCLRLVVFPFIDILHTQDPHTLSFFNYDHHTFDWVECLILSRNITHSCHAILQTEWPSGDRLVVTRDINLICIGWMWPRTITSFSGVLYNMRLFLVIKAIASSPTQTRTYIALVTANKQDCSPLFKHEHEIYIYFSKGLKALQALHADTKLIACDDVA